MTHITHGHERAYPKSDPVFFESRDPIPEITTYLKSVICTIKSVQYETDRTFNPKTILKQLSADLPDSRVKGVKEVFINDVVRLSTLFFNMSGQAKMKLQILLVNGNMCRLFHEDYYRQRLLCTYLGPGTEWLSHDNVNRTGLGKGKNINIVKDPSQINRAKTFDVLLLQGARSESGLGVVHRSPPIVNTGQVRILLKIDE